MKLHGEPKKPEQPPVILTLNNFDRIHRPANIFKRAKREKEQKNTLA